MVTVRRVVSSQGQNGQRRMPHITYNVLQVVAFVFPSQVTVLQSVPKLTILSISNDLGSSMGLWLGVSLYTIFSMIKEAGLRMAGPGEWRGLEMRGIMCLGLVILAPLPAIAFAVFYLM